MTLLSAFFELGRVKKSQVRRCEAYQLKCRCLIFEYIIRYIWNLTALFVNAKNDINFLYKFNDLRWNRLDIWSILFQGVFNLIKLIYRNLWIMLKIFFSLCDFLGSWSLFHRWFSLNLSCLAIFSSVLWFGDRSIATLTVLSFAFLSICWFHSISNFWFTGFCLLPRIILYLLLLPLS